MPPDLRHWQQDFLAALHSGAPSGPAMGIHRRTVLEAMENTLAAIFRVTQTLTGTECFAALAQAFFQAHPPQSPVLAEGASRMSDFLKTTPLAETLPYLPDLTRWEWLRWEVLQSAGAASPPWKPHDPRALLSGRVAFAPSTRLYASPWPIAALWEAHQEPEGLQPGWQPPAGHCHAVLYRLHNHVEALACSPALHAVLTALKDGALLGAALDAEALEEQDIAHLETAFAKGLVWPDDVGSWP